MRQIGKLRDGNIIVEMTLSEWLAILCNANMFYDLATICKDHRRKTLTSQTAMAKRAGISRNCLARIERGESNVSLEIYKRLMIVAFEDREVTL